ncbi:MAG: Hsp20/alpha crystallin family protein [Tepidisphaeraceae bacterium]
MSEKRPDERSQQELLEEIRQLKEKIRNLSEGAAESGGKSEGLAQGIAAALGKMVPGLGSLIDAASKMPEVQQRLSAIDEEVKRKFKEQPLHRAGLGIAGRSGRGQIGIPPAVRRGRGEQSTGKPAERGKHRGPRPPKIHISPETPAQLSVDVFDEGRKIVVLAEAPGMQSDQITVSLQGTVLLITVQAPHRQGVQRIELPCEVVGQPQTSLANGILSIQVRKADKP